jgi:RNA-binding protein NOB1
MRSAEEVPVHHLVADANAFFKNVNLVDIGSSIYTIQDVLNELRDEQTRLRLQALPYELHIREPTPESLRIVTNASKKTGDFSALSLVDLKVIALAHDLHVEHCGSESVNYNIQSIVEIVESRQKSRDILNTATPGFHDSKKTAGSEDEKELSEDDSEDEDWIGEENYEEAVQQIEGNVEPPKSHMTVACISGDFAVQNVLRHMKLDIVGIDGRQIAKLKTYILRCRCCYRTTSVMTKKFCPKCGNNALHRVAATVDDNGVMQLHIDWERLRVKRGLKHSIKMPKGGKHDDAEQIVEDQRMPHNRMARVHQEAVSNSPFDLHDVTSRSALLGLQTFHRDGRSRRNPNVPVKTRTGKKKKK